MRERSLIGLLVLAACHHAGAGEGLLEAPASFRSSQGNQEVRFAWSSGVDTSNGQMQATLPDGTVFRGSFIQIRADVGSDVAAPYFDVWSSPGWGVADPWYHGAPDDFVTVYSGTTLAHLRSEDGRGMRCKFLLRDPLSGFVGGAEGQCQLSDGKLVYDAVLARRSG